MELKRINSILLLSLIASAMMAVPARRGGILRTAEDGTQKMVYLHGNEHFHYMTDSEGRWLDENSLAPLSEEAKALRMEQKAAAEKKLRRVAQQTNGIGDKPNPAPRGLLILVNFKDQSFVTPKDTMDVMLNGDNFTRNYSYDYQYVDEDGKTHTIHYHIESEGSARKYFRDQSYGLYNPTFDVIGPLTVSQNTAYYGANSGSGADTNPQAMIKEACTLADQAGVDFTQYDNNNDGYVDFVYVIYAGYGEADGGSEETIWPHQWDISNMRHSVDGKYIGRYACGSELSFYSKLYAGIGTFCHEFSHVLGLPDLYETNQPSQGIHTLFEWDIMDYGPYTNDGNTPPSYSAYERFYMGWLTPRLLSSPENVTLYPINEDSGSSLMISTANTHNMSGWNPNPTTYYLLEARNQTGWDKYLPGSGMLITKISFSKSSWSANTVNNNYRAMGVDIQEAGSLSNRSSKTDAFPAGATSWTAYANHEITDIKRAPLTGVITFLYRGGVQTTVESVEPDNGSPVKILRNGQVLIQREGKIYDLLGRGMNQ